MIDVKKLKEDLLNSDPTLYCSVIAYLRGKLHMSKLNGGTLYDIGYSGLWNDFNLHDKKRIADERRHMFHWTKDDQAKFVESTIKAYTIEENELSKVA